MAALVSRFLRHGRLSESEYFLRPDLVEFHFDGIVRQFAISMPEVGVDLDRFCVWAVRPPTTAESSVKEIRDQASGRAIGHVFPITSLSPYSDYCADKLEGKFQRIFSSAATKAIVVEGVGAQAIVQRLDELTDGAPLSDLFADDLAIAVVGKENLKSVGTRVEDVKLLLQGFGYFIDDLAEEYRWNRVKPQLPIGSCTVAKVSPDLEEEVSLFSELICLASRQSSATASVLVYYQIVEIVAEKLLTVRLRDLANDPPASSWGLREALRKLASEKGRVVAICGQAMVGVDADSFNRLRETAGMVLRLCNAEFKQDASPGELLYAVRNLVVHNQRAFGADAYRALGEFVVELHRAVFAIIRRFSVDASG